MDAEIIAIGSELLLGTTVDTNSAYMAGQLAAAGVTLVRKSVVADHTSHIATLVNEALQRADLVICSGGLGPTLDDVTREAVAQATGRPLEFRQDLLDQIAARFAALHRPMGESNRQQAYVPAGARAIANARGTAPAFIVEDERGTVIVLPGVPHEMRHLFETAVLPYLRDERGVRDVILVRTLHVTGMGESVIGERIADVMERSNPAVGTSAKQGRCELRLVARSDTPETAEALLQTVEGELRERLGSVVLDTAPAEAVVTRMLRERGFSLALYEGNAYAPVYRALSSTAEGLALLSGVLIQPRHQPADAEATAILAETGALDVRERWASTLALGIQANPQPEATGLTAVSVALVFEGGSKRHTHYYDLNMPEGWSYVSNMALDSMRRFLLQ